MLKKVPAAEGTGQEIEDEAIQELKTPNSTDKAQSLAAADDNQSDDVESSTVTPSVTFPADLSGAPVGDLLKPAASMAQEAVRLLANTQITPEDKKLLHAQICALEGSMTALKQLLR